MATFGHSFKDDVMWFGGFLLCLSGFYSCVSLRLFFFFIGNDVFYQEK